MVTSSSASGSGWELYVEDNVLVGVSTDKSAFDEAEEINQTFAELVAAPEVNAHVACIEMSGSAGNKMLDGAEAAAQNGVSDGLEKWAIADPGIGKLAVKNAVDVPGLETKGFDSREAAMEWARE
jgi:hypothetical protein